MSNYSTQRAIPAKTAVCAVRCCGAALCLFLITGAVRSLYRSLQYNAEPDIWGLKPVVVMSGSMEPTLKTGSVVLLRKTEDIHKGDILLFITESGQHVLHRYVEDFDADSIITKGDSNPVSDPQPVKKENIYGKVLSF